MLSFYQLYADKSQSVLEYPKKATHVLDKWLLSKMESLTQQVNHYMQQYDVVRSSRALIEFVNQFSTWYLRLSRDRVKEQQDQYSSQLFGWALYRLALLFAPFCPFFSELVHQNLVDDDSSVHLADWPVADDSSIDENLEKQMALVMQIVEIGRRVRAENGAKLRHPLSMLKITHPNEFDHALFEELIKDELNVKELQWDQQSQVELSLEFDFKMTPELQAEAKAKDLIREIQTLRKESGLAISAQVKLSAPDWPKEWQTEIERRTNTSLVRGDKIGLL